MPSDLTETQLYTILETLYSAMVETEEGLQSEQGPIVKGAADLTRLTIAMERDAAEAVWAIHGPLACGTVGIDSERREKSAALMEAIVSIEASIGRVLEDRGEEAPAMGRGGIVGQGPTSAGAEVPKTSAEKR